MAKDAATKTLEKQNKELSKLSGADCCSICGMLCKAKNRKKGVFTLNFVLRAAICVFAAPALAAGALCWVAVVLSVIAAILFICTRSKKMCTCIPMLRDLHKKERKRLFSRAYWWTGLCAVIVMIIVGILDANCDPPTSDCPNFDWV